LTLKNDIIMFDGNQNDKVYEEPVGQDLWGWHSLAKLVCKRLRLCVLREKCEGYPN
jgi:hypothetical protein